MARTKKAASTKKRGERTRTNQLAVKTAFTPTANFRYDADRHPHMAYVACVEHGLTNDALARLFGVGEAAIEGWMRNHEEFKTAVRLGKDEFDVGNVEESLLRRAMGFEVEETKVTDNERNGTTVEVKKRKILPDVLACIFWLRNRQPQRWKDVRNVKQEGKIDHAHEHTLKKGDERLDLDQLNTAELESLHEILVKAENQVARKPQLDQEDYDLIAARQSVGGESSGRKGSGSLH